MYSDLTKELTGAKINHGLEILMSEKVLLPVTQVLNVKKKFKLKSGLQGQRHKHRYLKEF